MRPRARGTLTLGSAYGAAVLLVAACQGIRSDTVPEPPGYWSGPIEGPVPASIAGGEIIATRELAALVKQRRAIVVDASNAPMRPQAMAPGAPWLPVPHEAIPGTLWIPGIGHADVPEGTDAWFRERLARSSGGDRDHPIVVYCHERCWLSWNAAKRAIGYGYRRVYWYPDGVEGWRAAGFDTQIVQAEGPDAGR